MQRSFELKLQKLTDAGEFSGYASTYGNTDSTGDVIISGAFTRTLQSGKERPLLYQHRDPIGLVTLTDTPEGLVAKGKLSLDVQLAKDAYALLRDGVIKAMSIGFETIKADYKGSVRYLSEIKLWEVSLVTFPANELATVTSVKSYNPDAFRNMVRATLLPIQNDIMTAFTTKGRK
jgi:HK97 family phage prohead protease